MKHRRYWLPLTYEKKIEPVLKGEISQSIRFDSKINIGDWIAFHGWARRPYLSWSFRTPYLQVRYAEPILVFEDQLMIRGVHLSKNNSLLNELAYLDGIDPPTGEELLKVLLSYRPSTNNAQIIRWDPTPLKQGLPGLSKLR